MTCSGATTPAGGGGGGTADAGSVEIVAPTGGGGGATQAGDAAIASGAGVTAGIVGAAGARSWAFFAANSSSVSAPWSRSAASRAIFFDGSDCATPSALPASCVNWPTTPGGIGASPSAPDVAGDGSGVTCRWPSMCTRCWNCLSGSSMSDCSPLCHATRTVCLRPTRSAVEPTAAAAALPAGPRSAASDTAWPTLLAAPIAPLLSTTTSSHPKTNWAVRSGVFFLKPEPLSARSPFRLIDAVEYMKDPPTTLP